MERKIVYSVLICMLVIFMVGCRETPVESAVVSKANGISEDVIEQPLNNGELRILDIPSVWSMETTRGEYNNVNISVDLDMQEVVTGNLPVIEYEKSTISNESQSVIEGYFQENVVGDVNISDKRGNLYFETKAVLSVSDIGFYSELSEQSDGFYTKLDEMDLMIQENLTELTKAEEELAAEILSTFELEKEYELESVEPVGVFGDGNDSGEYSYEELVIKAEDIKVGAQYKFTPQIVENLSLNYEFDPLGGESQDSGAYTPPFSVETLTLVIVDESLVNLYWENKVEKVGVVTENTKLLSVSKVFDKLADILYQSNIQDIGEKETKYIHQVVKAQLGYSFVPAFENPNNVWAVPTWFFNVSYTIDASTDGEEVIIERPVQKVMLNALDGGYIRDTVQ